MRAGGRGKERERERKRGSQDALEMVPSIIPPLLKHLGSLIPDTALPFERNLVIPKRRLPRQTWNGNEPLFHVLSGTLSSIRRKFLRREFRAIPGTCGRGTGKPSKELRGRVESIKWHSEPRNFSLVRQLLSEFMAHSAFRPDYVQTAGEITRDLSRLPDIFLSFVPLAFAYVTRRLVSRASARSVINLDGQKCIKKA